MVQTSDRVSLGPYLLTKPLEANGGAEGYLALHQADHSNHVAYRFAAVYDKPGIRRFVNAVRLCQEIRHEHLLPIEYHTLDAQGHPWIVCPYTGDVDGLRTLRKLLREKSGQLHPFEAERALLQILDASRHAHKQSLVHGPMTLDDVLVDRHGSLLVQFYGLGRMIEHGPEAGIGEVIRDEVRSIVEIGYQLVTGLRAEEPLIPAGRLVKRLDPRWDAWISRGLEATAGFDSAAQALAALPCHLDVGDDEDVFAPGVMGGVMGGVRGVISRLRTGRS